MENNNINLSKKEIACLIIGAIIGLYIMWIYMDQIASQRCKGDMDKFEDMLDQFERDENNWLGRYFKISVVGDMKVVDLIEQYHKNQPFTGAIVGQWIGYVCIADKEVINDV